MFTIPKWLKEDIIWKINERSIITIKIPVMYKGGIIRISSYTDIDAQCLNIASSLVHNLLLGLRLLQTSEWAIQKIHYTSVNPSQREVSLFGQYLIFSECITDTIVF